MVLTDLPFKRGKLLHSRYHNIRRPVSAPPGKAGEDTTSEDGQESKEYAAFLKAQERKVGPDGFLDSSRYTHTFVIRKEKEDKSLGRGKPRALSDISSHPNVVSLAAKVEKDERDYQRRIKVVEDHMWQYKQEERELKRVEGDIIKNQRAVRHTVRDFGNAINKKRMAEDKKLNHSLERFTHMQQEHVHKKHEVFTGQVRKLQVAVYGNLTQEKNAFIERKRAIGSHRTHQNILTDLQERAQSRKVEIKKGDLSRQYQQKLSALELKRSEVMRLSQDFESKLRAKEEEQHKLKKELAELAITLNMEAQKGRVQRFENEKSQKKETTSRIQEDLDSDRNLENKMMKSDGDIKGAEMTKRRLSADLALTKAHLDIKKRDEQRHLTDTQIRLEDNTTTQRQLNEAARSAEMDLKAKQIEQKVEAHNLQRLHLLHASMRTKKDKEAAQQAVWEARYKVRAAQTERKKHEDSLAFFQKLVTKDQEREQSLFASVREAEYARQQHDAEVRRLQQQLHAMRAQNAHKLKEEAVRCSRTEKEVQEKLLRQKAELDKMHARREESYMQLQAHRQKMREDQHHLTEHEREHLRLQRIGTRSEVGPELYA